MKRLLMVAFHYPPASGTSGVQRALRFSSHLPEFGWSPIVLSAHPRAYENCSNDLMDEIPREAIVVRAQALDAKRHLSVAGRYSTYMALPDRWSSWFLGAVPAGMAAIRRLKPHAIWSTYPIATAHRVATWLAAWSGLPLITDFRDPMAQEGYPSHPRVWRSFDRVERKAIETSTMSTFTTPGAVDLYRARYPLRASGMHLLENGYDEAVFTNRSHGSSCLTADKRTLVHSGIVYPSERDPNSLFSAMRDLRFASFEKFSKLSIRFRAPVHEALLVDLARQYEVEDAVEVLPAIPYAEAIQEMQQADGLLLLQSSNCNAQIPAKFYEYLRAGPPILVVTDPVGDTAGAARKAGIETVAGFSDPAAIMSALDSFVSGRTDSMVPRKTAVPKATRRARTEELARLLNRLPDVSRDTP